MEPTTQNESKPESPPPTVFSVIAGMLRENTGRHFLDSGSAYGRNWERNQGKSEEAFDSAPAGWMEVRVRDGGELETCVTVDVYHFLTERLDYDERLDRIFQRFIDRPANEAKGYLEIMEEFPAWICARLNAVSGARLDAAGVYHDGSPMCVNTYTGEDCLSQIIQYVYFTTEGRGGAFVLLQIHGGCDMRGGYTRPRLFVADGSSHGVEAIFDNAQCSLYCNGKVYRRACSRCGEKEERAEHEDRTQVSICVKCGSPITGVFDERYCGASWSSDDAGSHWYASDGERDLRKYPLASVPEDAEGSALSFWKRGELLVDERERSGALHCPQCGGKLAVGAY